MLQYNCGTEQTRSEQAGRDGGEADEKNSEIAREHFLFLLRVARGKSLFPDLWAANLTLRLLQGSSSCVRNCCQARIALTAAVSAA